MFIIIISSLFMGAVNLYLGAVHPNSGHWIIGQVSIRPLTGHKNWFEGESCGKVSGKNVFNFETRSKYSNQDYEKLEGFGHFNICYEIYSYGSLQSETFFANTLHIDYAPCSCMIGRVPWDFEVDGWGVVTCRVAEVGSLSARAKMAIRILVKRVVTIFTTNSSFLRVIANLQI